MLFTFLIYIEANFNMPICKQRLPNKSLVYIPWRKWNIWSFEFTKRNQHLIKNNCLQIHNVYTFSQYVLERIQCMYPPCDLRSSQIFLRFFLFCSRSTAMFMYLMWRTSHFEIPHASLCIVLSSLTVQPILWAKFGGFAFRLENSIKCPNLKCLRIFKVCIYDYIPTNVPFNYVCHRQISF